MSRGASGEPGFFERKVSLKWFFIMVAGLVVIMAAVVVTVLVVDRSNDEARRAALANETSSPNVTSPYDMTELPADTDLDVLADAAFISILVPNDNGTLTSYGVSSDLPATQALSQAIATAEEVDPLPEAAAAATTSTITFVFPSRETLTFTLLLDQGLIARGGQAWRPEGDLALLVESAIKAPQ